MDEQRFRLRYGPWALVAGGSVGLGAAYASRLGSLGLNLLLIARRSELLEETARRIRERSGVEVRTLVLDLGSGELVERVTGALDGLDLGLLVCNAAFGTIKPFLRCTTAELLEQLEVNCRAPLLLSRLCGERFRSRGRGGIILMSSMVGFQGSSLLCTYAATKAFNLVLGESLYHDLQASGVDVLACAPGATRTPSYLASNARYGRIKPRVDEPETVVEEALSALGRRPLQVVNPANRLLLQVLSRVLGRRFAASLMNHNIRSMYPHSL